MNEALKKFDEDSMFLPSEPIDVTRVASAYYTDEEISKALQRIPEGVREDFKDHIFQASFWKHIESKQVPFDFLKKRVGQRDKDTGEFKMLEYFPVDYTITELNRLFPGWWMEDMHGEADYKLRTYRIFGYLCVQYPTLSGKQVTKRWATASTAIKIAKETDEKTGMFEASQPDDLEKAALTEWYKIAGKYYGIGLEIYSQRISPELRSLFEDIVRDWGVYANEVKNIAKTIETGTGFRDFIRSLPTVEQTQRFREAVKWIPENAMSGEKRTIEVAWTNFVLLRNDSDKNRAGLESFLQKMEQAAQTLKQQKESK